jgi:uncharacterized protein
VAAIVGMKRRASLIGRLVALCATRAWIVVALAAVNTVAVAAYVVGHFEMKTDTYELLSPKLPWRARETAFNQAFPQAGAKIVVVVDGETPELAEQAAAALADALRAQPALFHAVRRPDGGAFWARNGLLYAPLADVRRSVSQLITAQPFLGPLAADPSLRGLMSTLSTALQGVSRGDASLQDLRAPIQRLADALESLQAGKPTFFSWRSLITAAAPGRGELRHVILVDPELEFSRLEPGAVATQAIRRTALALQFDDAHGVRVRLTGPVPLQDEELATLGERALLIATLATGAIVLMLWMAVRSVRLIAAILVTPPVGGSTSSRWPSSLCSSVWVSTSASSSASTTAPNAGPGWTCARHWLLPGVTWVGHWPWPPPPSLRVFLPSGRLIIMAWRSSGS